MSKHRAHIRGILQVSNGAGGKTADSIGDRASIGKFDQLGYESRPGTIHGAANEIFFYADMLCRDFCE